MAHPFSAETQARLDRFKQVTVAHPVLTAVDEALTNFIWEPGGFTQVLVYGPTGVGKSTVIRRIAERLGTQPRVGAKPARPVIVIETPAPFSLPEWYMNVLIALDEWVIEDRHYRDVQEARAGRGRGAKPAEDAPALRLAVEEALKAREVRALIFDEAQHLLGSGKTDDLRRQWDWLKSLSNTTNVLHILIGPYELRTLRNVSGQASRRGTDLHFPRYRQDEEHGRTAFQSVALALLKQTGLVLTGQLATNDEVRPLLEEWLFLYERSVGCVGVLKEWLVRSVSLAVRHGETTLTLERLRQHALTIEQCQQMAVELIAGEQQVALEATGLEQLHQMLGIVPPDEVPPPTPAEPPRRRGRTPGKRNATRDPVG